jgi:nucleoside-diphosphate-sugar epimerase
MISRYLLTGTSTGLGAFLLNRLPAVYFDRLQKQIVGHHHLPAECFEAIVHCGWPRTLSDSKKSDLKEQLELLKSLSRVNANRFIFVSSVEASRHEAQISRQGQLKLDIEKASFDFFANVTILRCSALFGPGMKENQAVSIMRSSRRLNLSLSPESGFEFVHYQYVLSAIQQCRSGIFELRSAEPIELGYLAQLCSNNKIDWGNYQYQTPEPMFENIYPKIKSSLEIIPPSFIDFNKNRY